MSSTDTVTVFIFIYNYTIVWIFIISGSTNKMADMKCEGNGRTKEEISILGDDKQSEGQLMTEIQKEARKEDNHNLTSEDNQDLNTANDVVKRVLHSLKVHTPFFSLKCHCPFEKKISEVLHVQ